MPLTHNVLFLGNVSGPLGVIPGSCLTAVSKLHERIDFPTKQNMKFKSYILSLKTRSSSSQNKIPGEGGGTVPGRQELPACLVGTVGITFTKSSPPKAHLPDSREHFITGQGTSMPSGHFTPTPFTTILCNVSVMCVAWECHTACCWHGGALKQAGRQDLPISGSLFFPTWLDFLFGRPLLLCPCLPSLGMAWRVLRTVLPCPK